MSHAIKRLGYSKKKCKLSAINKNCERVLSIRKEVALKFTGYWTHPKKPIFIDETGFQSDLIENYLYSKKGQLAIINNVVKTQNISVICAITDDSMIGINASMEESQLKILDVLL